MIIRGEHIFQLIPQRPPIVMVDVVYSADETCAETGLTVHEDNIFVRDGRFREPGLSISPSRQLLLQATDLLHEARNPN